MNLTRALPLLTCAALAACATPPDSTDKSLAAAVGAKIVTNCAGNATRNTCVPGSSSSDPTRCHVFVIDRGDKPPLVYPATLMTPRPDRTAPPIVIVWHLAGADFRNRLEGPDLWSNPEFSVGTPTDSEGDTAATARSSHFKYQFLNTTGPTEHKYSITFVNSNGRTMTCDPKINNSGG